MVSIDDVKDGDGNLSKEEFIDMVAKHPKDDVTFDVFFCLSFGESSEMTGKQSGECVKFNWKKHALL